MGRPSLSDTSMFGSKRFCIQMSDLITDNCDMFFSDFYCMRIGRPHYIQLVIAPKYTNSHRRCQQLGLPKLNIYSNPFLSKSDESFKMVRKRCGSREQLWIEIFYTEDINMNEFPSSKLIEHVHSMGTGTWGGRPRCSGCSTCA